MGRPPAKELTERELEVMQAFWKQGEATAAEVARALREHRVHRVFVVEDRSLLGVISTFDVLRLVERSKIR